VIDRTARLTAGSDGPPDLSVVIVAGCRRDRAERALRSVIGRPSQATLEVLVVDISGSADPWPAMDGDSRVRWVRLSAQESFGAARAEAVHLARSGVLVFLEEHAEAHPGWADALARAHHGPWACVGAEVHSLNPGIGWSDCVYLVGYSAWMPPAESRIVKATAAHNSSYKKASLEALGNRLTELLLVEPLLQGLLQRQGEKLYLESDARFAHENETSLHSLAAYYWWNRSFGRIRAQVMRWSPLKKLAYALLSPLAPWVRTARQLPRMARRGGKTFRDFVRNLPRIFALHVIAVSGTVVGSWVGTPEDDRRFTDLEFRQDADR
jgi:hypothetical protein